MMRSYAHRTTASRLALPGGQPQCREPPQGDPPDRYPCQPGPWPEWRRGTPAGKNRPLQATRRSECHEWLTVSQSRSKAGRLRDRQPLLLHITAETCTKTSGGNSARRQAQGRTDAQRVGVVADRVKCRDSPAGVANGLLHIVHVVADRLFCCREPLVLCTVASPS